MNDDFQAQLPLGLGTFPGPASWKTIDHFLQYTHPETLGRFTKYDYGTIRNQGIYGQNTPPLYSLNTTRVPVAIIYELSAAVNPPLVCSFDA